jgi:hypothetical protein
LLRDKKIKGDKADEKIMHSGFLKTASVYRMNQEISRSGFCIITTVTVKTIIETMSIFALAAIQSAIYF